jgi:hypothetical protein
MTSKRAQSEQNLAKLIAWLTEAETSGTQNAVGTTGPDGFKVNRTQAAKACGFARSAFSTNPAFVEAVTTFEARQTACKDQDRDAVGYSPDEAGSNGSGGGVGGGAHPIHPEASAQLRKAIETKDKEISNLRRRLHAKTVEAELLRDELRQTRSFLDSALPKGLPFPGRGTE